MAEVRVEEVGKGVTGEADERCWGQMMQGLECQCKGWAHVQRAFRCVGKQKAINEVTTFPLVSVAESE